MQPEIIVALIGGMATIVAALIGLYSKSKKKDDTESASAKKFWDALSDTIVIVYGAEYPKDKATNDHFKLSPRDLEAAETILAFLVRRYPQKVIVPLQAVRAGWQVLLQKDTDLVIIGGFAVNVEFAHHRPVYQQDFGLKMGRLCRFEGRRVYHVGLSGLSASTVRDLRRQPQAIESLPSKLVSRDFALVCNTRGYIYGSNRRVIAIAGIKGNGTLGAAMHLTRDRQDSSQPSTIVEKLLRRDDTLELVIQTDIVNDTVNETKTVEAMLNGKSILDNSIGLWEPCELGQFCKDCTFGEDSSGNKVVTDLSDPGLESREGSRVNAVIFDLDDTLVDTFSMLITPLEVKAAKKMVQMDRSLPDPDELAALLLELRRNSPVELEKELLERIPDVKDDALKARRRMFTDLVPYRLSIDPRVRLLLRELGRNHSLYLLTEGDPDFQNAKIDHLGIRAFFKEIKSVSTGSESKQRAIESLLERYHLAPTLVVIIGNRLDKEICAGNRLGITTVWVKHGEGCAMEPGEHTGLPDYTVENVLELGEIFNLCNCPT